MRFVKPVYGPVTNIGWITSHGDAAMKADAARLAFSPLPTTTPLDGSGITVGVLSDSASPGGMSASQSSGDLPFSVNVLNPGVGGDEGVAMLEIVYDVAPGADLAFATAWRGQLASAQNILGLAAARADVIVDDVIYPDESMFVDGPVRRRSIRSWPAGRSTSPAPGTATGNRTRTGRPYSMGPANYSISVRRRSTCRAAR